MNTASISDEPLRIFLVEDSPMDIHLVKIALSRRRSTTQLTTFKNGEMAISHLREHPSGDERPNLTILDLNLPGMDGIQVLEKLKSDPDLERIPVVVFTTTQLTTEIKRCYDKGAAKVITKPAELVAFLGTVQGIEDGLRRSLEGDGELGQCIDWDSKSSS